MPEKLDGATRLFPIIGDPIKFVKSPGASARWAGRSDRVHTGVQRNTHGSGRE